MKRKREAEISRRERNGERDPEQPVQSRGSYDYVPRKYK